MNAFDRSDPRGVLARTLWGEARGDGRLGMLAVAGCILNRVRHPRWWGHDVLSVCLAPWQFSCWNQGDPNLPQMMAVTDKDAEFRIAWDIAGVALIGGLLDLTGGADSYYDIRMPQAPYWAARAVATVIVQHHRFMRVELPDDGEPDAPPVSIHSPAAIACRPAPRVLTADELNAAELERVRHMS